MTWHLYQQVSLTQTAQYQGYIPQLVRKGIPTPTGLQRMDDRNAVKKYQVKKAHFVPLCKCAQKWLKSAFHFSVNNNRISFSMVFVFFMHNLFMPNNLDLLVKNKCWINQKARIPQCPGPISHNAPLCKKKNMHIAVAIWCIVGYLSDTWWEMWDGSINS